MKKNLFYLLLAKNSSENKTELESETLPYTFKSNGHRLRNYRIYGAEGGVGDLDGGTEKYIIPVTAAGKNFVNATVESIKSANRSGTWSNNVYTLNGVSFAVNADGSITCNGTATATTTFIVCNDLSLDVGTYILNGCPQGGSASTYKLDTTIGWKTDIGNGVQFSISDTTSGNVRIVIYSGYNCNDVTFYPMVRISGITDNTYEQYREPKTYNILLDSPIDENEYIDFREQKCYRSGNSSEIISLPALRSIDGTNVLSVGTTVQPEKVYVQGGITEIPSASLQSLNLSPDLQTTDFDGDKASLDVMPIEKPNLNLNEVGGDESAE